MAEREHGPNYVWFMNGATRLDGTGLELAPDVHWRIVGVGDFNGDGKPDLVWRNVVTGENRLWYLQGVTKSAEAALPADPDVNWQIVEVGDMNGDRKLDLIWRHATTGANRVWYLGYDAATPNTPTKTGESAVTPLTTTTWVLGTGPVWPCEHGDRRSV